jgi:hypothetical protein
MKQTNILFVVIALLALSLTSACSEWGQQTDPPAGNQVYPRLVKLLSYNFNRALTPEQAQFFAYPNGAEPAIAADDSLGGVLHFNGGYARMANPATQVTLQTAISLTFWVKQATEDTAGALFSFQNEEGTESLYLTGSGTLAFQGADASYENTLNTSLLTPGEPQFVSVIISLSGYSVYVNSQQALDVLADTEETFAAMVAFANRAPYLYLGYGSGADTREMWMDDLTLYRNTITAAERATPTKAQEMPYAFPPFGTLGYYKLDGDFTNQLNPDQGGEFITVEFQSTPSAFETDATRGAVWHQQEGWFGNANGWAYTQFVNPLKGKELSGGASINFWANPPWINYWDNIFSLNNGQGALFWFNSGAYVGYNSGTGNWFDCQVDERSNTNALPVGKWTFVTINLLPDGFAVYYNAERRFTQSDNAKWASSAEPFDYTQPLTLLAGTNYFNLGGQTYWNAAPALVDDIFLVERPLTEPEIKDLYDDTRLP